MTDTSNSNDRQDYALLAARILMASLFLFSGIEKIVDYQGVLAFSAQFAAPAPALFMPLVIIFELVAGVALIIGWKTRVAATGLALWMALLGPWFHQFWNAPPAIWQFVIDGFFHHAVMIGGMIYVAAFGPGKLSIDKA